MADGSLHIPRQRLACFGIGNVEGVGPGLAALLDDLPGRAFCRRAVQIGRDDPRAFLRKASCDGCAIALTGPGDKCDTPFEQHPFRLPELN